MLTVYDALSAILIICFAIICLQSDLIPSRQIRWTLIAVMILTTLAARVVANDAAARDWAAATMLAGTAVIVGRRIILARHWPVHALAVALTIITAVGAYLRADRLREVIDAHRPLQTDVVYYHEQALHTANPFAAGHKSPLWPALHAPVLQICPDANISMRVLSWICGIAMLPLVGWSLGRLLHPIAGVLTAGFLATEPWLIDLCCEGLREEAGVCVWMVVLFLLFRPNPSSQSPYWAALAGGVLLLLRNISIVPLLVLSVWAIWHQRWRRMQALTILLGPLLIVSPFYIDQYRVYGDAFAMEKRDARYHANGEFGLSPPASLPMPSTQESARDPFAGPPLSPLAYLLRYHTFREFASNQIIGVAKVVIGAPFTFLFDTWWRLLCAAGVIASLAVPRARFIGLFVIFGVLGISAHLLVLGRLELRLLLPVIVIWTAAGYWLLVFLAQLAVERTRCHPTISQHGDHREHREHGEE